MPAKLALAVALTTLVACASPTGADDGGSGGGAGGGGGAADGGSGGGAAGGGGGSAGGGGAGGGSGGGGGGATDGGWWRPAPGTSWQWQLSGTLDLTVDAGIFDIDLFETTSQQIASLHGLGRKVICYFDTAYEPGRPDSAQLDPYKGNPVQGWPGQYWLDTRAPQVLAVMKARIALAQTKACDGLEADDVDARSNNPGFPITASEQQAFIRALAQEAHARGMGFGLKNDLDEIPQLLADVDFAINEECQAYSECAALAPFISAGKAVFHCEYTSGDLAAKGATVCPAANAANFDSIVKHLDLDAPRHACR